MNIRYAVAVREGSDLWLTLWVRSSRRGEFFVVVPRGERDSDPTQVIHLDGTLHIESHGHKTLETKVQPLAGAFRGTVGLGTYGGYGPRGVGAICDPAPFSGVVDVARGVPNDKLCFCASSTTPSFASNNAGLPGRFCAVLNCAAQ